MNQAILVATLQGCAMICCTLLLRSLFKNRLPKATFLLLWTAALCRLLLPVAIPSPVSVYNLLPSVGASSLGASSAVARSIDISYEGTTQIAEEAATAGTGFHGIPADAGIQWLPLIWAVVAVLLAAALLISWIRGRRQLRDALPLSGNADAEEWLQGVKLLRPLRICTSDRITSPLTCGILRPRIFLPSSMRDSGGDSLRFILGHELIHIRRFDCLWKGLFAAACCLHWFNPLVWAMLVLSGRDMELSCDEAVLRRMGGDVREGYAMSLITLAEKRLSPTVLAHFSKNSVRERVVAVMRFKRLSKWAVACAAALAFVLTAVLATSPWEMGSGDMASEGVTVVSDNAVSFESGDNYRVFSESADTLHISTISDINSTSNLSGELLSGESQGETIATVTSAHFPRIPLDSEAALPTGDVISTLSFAGNSASLPENSNEEVRFETLHRFTVYNPNGEMLSRSESIFTFSESTEELLNMGFTSQQLWEVNQICKKHDGIFLNFSSESVPSKEDVCTFSMSSGEQIGPFSMKTQRGEALAAAKEAVSRYVTGEMSEDRAEIEYAAFFFKLFCVQ